MSDVVKFPGADKPIAATKTSHSQAFRDLESRLCDCVCMANIACQMAAIARLEDDELMFAIMRAADMLRTLKVDYYAAYEQGRPIEPP